MTRSIDRYPIPLTKAIPASGMAFLRLATSANFYRNRTVLFR